MTQTAAQPGIVSVWVNILQQGSGSAQFVCVDTPAALVGKRRGAPGGAWRARAAPLPRCSHTSASA
jgi:hypothetical protein